MRLGGRLSVVALGLALAAGCKGSLDGVVAGQGPTASQLTEVMLATQDQLEATAAALTLTSLGQPPGVSLPPGCPSASGAGDADGDGIPDALTLTFANPPCSVSGVRGGSLALSGSAVVTDSSQSTTRGYLVNLTNLAWTYTDSTGVRSYTATRNGTWVRTGTATTAAMTSQMVVVLNRPNRAAATVTLGLLAGYAPTTGTIAIGSPVASGTLTLTGSLGWHRSTEQWDLAVTTLTPLVWDPSCTGTPQRITGGQLLLAGTVSNADGAILLTWNGCGTDPTRQWLVPAQAHGN